MQPANQVPNGHSQFASKAIGNHDPATVTLINFNQNFVQQVQPHDYTKVQQQVNLFNDKPMTSNHKAFQPQLYSQAQLQQHSAPTG